MVGSSGRFTFWEKNRPDDGVKWGSLEPFVADIWAGFTRRCLLTCDKGRRWELAASGPLGCHGNHCAPMLAAAVSRERAQGNCWHDR